MGLVAVGYSRIGVSLRGRRKSNGGCPLYRQVLVIGADRSRAGRARCDESAVRWSGHEPCPLSAREARMGPPGEISMCVRTNCARTDISPLASTTKSTAEVSAGAEFCPPDGLDR